MDSFDTLSFDTPGAWAMAGEGRFVPVGPGLLESQGGSGLLWYTPSEFSDFRTISRSLVLFTSRFMSIIAVSSSSTLAPRVWLWSRFFFRWPYFLGSCFFSARCSSRR